ncbi:hypothetical protein LCGC14_0294900 [marine sediment metagenome]|uniref:Uncharacterized protein n=1 Tax=marine sediment metagenome TaxID=412755 RepID=A0A0F9U942_9ZZZZ
MDFWDMHQTLDATCDCPPVQCDACVIDPVICDECGRGFIHTHFDEDLEALEGRCDYCSCLGVPIDEDEIELGVT